MPLPAVVAGDRLRPPTGLPRTSASATERSSASASVDAAAHDRMPELERRGGCGGCPADLGREMPLHRNQPEPARADASAALGDSQICANGIAADERESAWPCAGAAHQILCGVNPG